MSQCIGLSSAQQPGCPSLRCHVEADVDVLIEAAGAICLFHLVTERAEAWIRLRDDRDWYTLVGALVVDDTHTETFAHWMRAEGLNVSLAAARGRV